MKLKCPACGALSSLDVLIASEGVREAAGQSHVNE